MFSSMKKYSFHIYIILLIISCQKNTKSVKEALFDDFYKYAERLRGKKLKQLDNNEKKVVLDFYRNDNKKLSKFLDLNLRKWRYY